MYTATVKLKEETDQGLKVTVDFSNGVKTITESAIPQDEDGLKYWVKSRLTSLNSIETIDSSYALDTEIDVSDPTPEPLTQAQIDEQQWFVDYYRWVRVKETLIDTGVIAIDHPKAVALLTKVQTNIKAEYVDKI